MIITVLKIIGLILLYILLFIIALLLLVLFCPIKYNISGKYADNDKSLLVKVSFLLFIKAKITYIDKPDYYISVFGFKIFGNNIRKNKSKVKDNDDWTSNISGCKDEKENISLEDNKTDIKQTDDISSNDIQSDVKKSDVIMFLIDKNIEVSKKVDKIVSLVTADSTKELVVFIFKNIKNILKHIFPKKHYIYIKFGFDDPSLTGQLLGLLSVIKTSLNLNINFESDFDNKCFESDFYLKGRIRLIYLLIIAIKVFFNKNVQQIIRRKK